MAHLKTRIITALAAVTLGLAVLALGGGNTSVLAQERVDIRFERGATSTTINGTIRGNEYIDYVVNARGGQTMVVSLAVTGTNGNGSAYFNILPAGQDYDGPYIGSTDDDRRAEVTVPYDGNWAIRVYLMGNDRDAGKTVGYSIDVYIAPGSGGSQGSDSSGGSGVAPLPEEDFFVVRLSGTGGALNVRQAPRPGAQKIGEFRDGTIVRNLGGCTMSNGQQWCNVQASSGGVIGWVSARFLALPSPGGGSSSAPGSGDTMRVTGVPANDVLNVRSAPGAGNRIVGALGNGDRVRMLGCQPVGNARWCEIEMMTDTRERGWVNARYLTNAGTASQLPSPPPQSLGADEATTERVRFPAGSTGTELAGAIPPGGSKRYIVNARSGQNLYVRVAHRSGPRSEYQIFNPDGTFLLDMIPTDRDYGGQLWQSGDHVIEVINRRGNRAEFTIIIGID